MLIRDASLLDGRRVDIRVRGGMIAEMAPRLEWRGETVVLQARGGAVLPGLHDHHVHLFALAASLHSVACGPPLDAAGLRARLRGAAGTGWVRGVGYHEQVAGEIDRAWMDDAVPDRPVRVQHRSGRLWIFNGAALGALGAGQGGGPDALTGRLYDGDDWMRERLPSAAPSLGDVGALLAGFGVTAMCDVTPGNDAAQFALLAEACACGALPQRVAVMGAAGLDGCADRPGCSVLGRKVHLHEGDYPDPDAFLADIARVRAAGRQIAVHCVTEADLVFTLSLFEEAGAYDGYRIEHGSMVPAGLIGRIAACGARVVTQPHFIAERGAAYSADIPLAEQDCLYRAASLIGGGVRVAGGSDAPFGGANPWASMAAAVARRTASGAVLGAEERLSPEAALGLFTSHWADAGGARRRGAGGAYSE